MRVRFAALFTAGSLLFAVPTTAAEPPPAPRKAFVSRVFSVADLVTPIPDFCQGDGNACPEAGWGKPTPADGGEALCRTVTSLVRPESWAVAGGAGRIEYFDVGRALRVDNTPEVVAAVAVLLERLRKLQDVCVTTEVRVLKVPAGFSAATGLDKAETLTARELALVLEAAQKERGASVMQAPKLTTFDGQTATIRVGDRKEFVTAYEATQARGKLALMPKATAVDLGDAITLCGRVSADEKFVNLKAKVTHTAEASYGEQAGVIGLCDAAVGSHPGVSPMLVSMKFHFPDVKTTTVEKHAAVPSGCTVVVGRWTEEQDDATPLTSKVPYLNRLFKNANAKATCEVVVLATTAVIRADAAPAAAAAPKPAVEGAGHAPLGEVIGAAAAEPAPLVIVQALVMDVPAGFLADAGLPADEGGAGATALTLTPREVQMLVAHIRKEKGRAGNIDILSHPYLVMTDSKAGIVQVGAERRVTTGLEIVAGFGGAVTVAPKSVAFEDGVRLRVTPQVTGDGSVDLRTQVEWSQVVPGRTTPVTLPPAVTGRKESVTYHLGSPVVNCQTAEATARVPGDHTAVLRGIVFKRTAYNPEDGFFTALAKQCGPERRELVVLLTPHVAKADAVKPAGGVTPAPVPVPAPVRGRPVAPGGFWGTPSFGGVRFEW